MGKIKQLLLTLFFVLHLLLIFFQGTNTTIDSYWSYHYNKESNLPRILPQNEYNEWYYILTGINTGYGFYGIKASTNKYIKITYYDKHDTVMFTDRYLGLTSINGIQRLGGFSSYLANYIAATEKLMKEDSLSSNVEFRKEYVTKSMKWLGKEKAFEMPDCISYKVELFTIVPDYYTEVNKKPTLYAIQSNTYRAKEFN